MAKKYLDYNGLSHLWEKLKAFFVKGNNRVFTGTCSTAAGTVAKVVTCPSFAESDLIVGAIVMVKFTATNSGAVGSLTLKVGSATAKPIKYRVNNGSAANLPAANYLVANQIIPFIFDGTNWVAIINRDSDDLAHNVRVNTNVLVLHANLTRYMWLFTRRDGTLLPAYSGTYTTATTKTLTTESFDPFGPIYYYNTTAEITAGNLLPAGNSYIMNAGVYLSYAFNAGGSLTINKPAYVKCIPLPDGQAKLAGNDCIVQELPSTDDGFIYIYLGEVYATSSSTLSIHHPVYYVKNGVVRLYTGYDDIAAGDGVNLLRNSADFSGWEYGGTAVGEKLDLEEGVVKISNSGSTSNTNICTVNWIGSGWLADYFGKTIVVSFDIMSPDWSEVVETSSYTALGGVAVQFGTSEKTPYSGWISPGTTGRYQLLRLNDANFWNVVPDAELVNGKWIHYTSKPIKIDDDLFSIDPTEIDGFDSFTFYFMLRRNGTVYFRRPKIEIGTVSTDWTPAPEDIPIEADGRNYFSIVNSTMGYLKDSGVLTNPDSYCELTSDYIPTEAGDRWSMSIDDRSHPSNWMRYVFFDADKVRLGACAFYRPYVEGFTAPLNAKYVRVSYRTNGGECKCKLEKGMRATGWTIATEDLEYESSRNLCPFYSLDLNTDKHWNTYGATPSTIHSYTKMGDGWVRIQADNSQGSSNVNSYYGFIGSHEHIKPGVEYTFLFEIRNNNSTGTAASKLYVVQAGTSSNNGFNPAFWGNFAAKGLEGAGQRYAEIDMCGVGTEHVKRFVKLAQTSADGHWASGVTAPTGLLALNAICSKGTVLDLELRVSLYEGVYLGPYKPYIELNAQPDLGYVTPQMFGAKGDAVSTNPNPTDDTAAIQRALDTSRNVYFPPGVYAISSTLNIPSKTHIWGVDGDSKIRAVGTFTGDHLAQVAEYDADNLPIESVFNIEHLELDCNDQLINGLFLLRPYNRSTVRDVIVNNCCKTGLYVGDTRLNSNETGYLASSGESRSQTLVVDNCMFIGSKTVEPKAPLVYLFNSFELNFKDTKILYIKSNKSVYPCLELDFCYNSYIRGCSFASTYSEAVYITRNCRYFRLIGNTYENIADRTKAYARSTSTTRDASWLSSTNGGSALTPVAKTVYQLAADKGNYHAGDKYMWNGSSYVKLSDAEYRDCAIFCDGLESYGVGGPIIQGLILETTYYNVSRTVRLQNVQYMTVLGSFRTIDADAFSVNTTYYSMFNGGELATKEYVDERIEEADHGLPVWEEFASISTTANTNVVPWGAVSTAKSIASYISTYGQPVSIIITGGTLSNPVSAVVIGNNLYVYSRTATTGLTARILFGGKQVATT